MIMLYSDPEKKYYKHVMCNHNVVDTILLIYLMNNKRVFFITDYYNIF